MNKESAELTDYFKEKWEETYKRILPLNKKLTYTFMKRFIGWAGSYDEAQELVDWIFEHWNKLKSECGVTGTPSVSILGSSSWVKTFLDKKEEGFKISTKNRVSDDDSPEEGW